MNDLHGTPTRWTRALAPDSSEGFLLLLLLLLLLSVASLSDPSITVGVALGAVSYPHECHRSHYATDRKESSAALKAASLLRVFLGSLQSACNVSAAFFTRDAWPRASAPLLSASHVGEDAST